MFSLFRKQPRAFHMIFMLEIWERFGFYTVQGILTLYFIRFLGFDDTTAYYTFGAFSALVYGMVAFGGYLGDRILGTKRTIVLGLVVLSLGYLFLAFASRNNVFYALGLVCVGNGIFKANPSSLLAKCYDENDPRLHSGFTLYYMAINLGSTFSLFLGPYLSSNFGYGYAYFLSFVGLVIGLINYMFQRHHIRHINTLADQRTVSFLKWLVIFFVIAVATLFSAYLLQHVQIAKNLVWVVSIFVISYYFWNMKNENSLTLKKMWVALILMIEGIVFFILYQQMPTSLNLFAVHNVIPSLLGISIDPQSFQALNPIWILILSPLLAFSYSKLNERGTLFAIPYKFALGMICCGISFGLLFFSRYLHDDNGMVSSYWLVASYLFQSTGELLVSALGVAMIAELVPDRMVGFVMGMWFLTSAIAGFLGATVASYTALPADLPPGTGSLMIYTQVFATIGLVSLTIGACMWLSSGYLTRIIKGQSKEADMKQNSKKLNMIF